MRKIPEQKEGASYAATPHNAYRNFEKLVDDDPAEAIRLHADALPHQLVARCLFKAPVATLKYAPHKLSVEQIHWAEEKQPGCAIAYAPERLSQDDINNSALEYPVITAQHAPHRMREEDLLHILKTHRSEIIGLLSYPSGANLGRRLHAILSTEENPSTEHTEILEAIPPEAL